MERQHKTASDTRLQCVFTPWPYQQCRRLSLAHPQSENLVTIAHHSPPSRVSPSAHRARGARRALGADVAPGQSVAA